MDREQLKELIRTEPGIVETMNALWAEYEPIEANARALHGRWLELREQLGEIEKAKTALVTLAKSEVPPSAPNASSSPVSGSDTEDSPVGDQTAEEAKDHISRMRSSEKLQDVIDNDPRVTVVEAARKRLDELSGI